MEKKRKDPAPEFRRDRAELAGELTPNLYPGPVTRAHPGRFKDKGQKKDDKSR